MSLPKRDGVHGRYYLIHKPDTDPEVLEHADQCIQDVLDGTAEENHSGYPVVVRNQNGTPFLPSQLLERYLSKLPLKGFPYGEAVVFCDALRRLAGWKEIDHTLGQYIEHQVQERYFEVGEKEDYFSAYLPCTVWPELRPEDVDEGLLRFACYVAVCYTVYGASYDSLTTEHILGLVSQLRPDMVKQLKTGGSGKLPKDIQRRKTEHFTASANDAFATIRITARGLHRGVLWGNPGLPVRGAGAGGISPQLLGGVPWAREDLPAHSRPAQKGNQSALCLRCAAPQSASGYGAIRSPAMREFEWYQNSRRKPARCPAPSPCLPWGWRGRSGGGWCATTWDRCDDEHSSLQEKFIHAFFKKYALPPSPCRCWSTASSLCRV